MAKGCIDICKAIQHHTTLREILMSNNFIGPDGARQLAHKVLADTKYITEVHLANNGIFPDGAKEIGIALANKKYLEVLNLRRNDIGKEGIAEPAHGVRCSLTHTPVKRFGLMAQHIASLAG